MQQTREQYSWALWSRGPTQWMIATVPACSPSAVRISPPVGPLAFDSRSNSRPVMMLGDLP